MSDWKHTLLEHLPFVCAAVTNSPVKLNTTRILESLLIAGVTGAITMYGVQQKLDVQMAEMKSQMAEIKQRISEERIEAIARDVRLDDRINSLHNSPARNGR